MQLDEALTFANTATTAASVAVASSITSSFVPAATPPPGVTPDFENPRDVLHTVNWINTGLCLGFVVVFSVVRLYVKIAIKRDAVLLEEFCFVVSWVCVNEFRPVCVLPW